MPQQSSETARLIVEMTSSPEFVNKVQEGFNWLNANPRFSGMEHDVWDEVQRRFHAMDWGDIQYSVTSLPAGNGGWIDIGVGEGGPIVAVRGDMDALPEVDPKTGAKVPKHRCGHDAHTQEAISTGDLIRELKLRGHAPGVYRIIFQPSEEGSTHPTTAAGQRVYPDQEATQGAEQIIEAGGMEGVGAFFALHNWSGYPPGMLGIGPGPIHAGLFDLTLSASGPGSHGSRPAGLHPSAKHREQYASRPEDVEALIVRLQNLEWPAVRKRVKAIGPERLAAFCADLGPAEFHELAHAVHWAEIAANAVAEVPLSPVNPQRVEPMAQTFMRAMKEQTALWAAARGDARGTLSVDGDEVQPTPDQLLGALSIPGRPESAKNVLPGNYSIAGTVRFLTHGFGDAVPELTRRAFVRAFEAEFPRHSRAGHSRTRVEQLAGRLRRFLQVAHAQEPMFEVRYALKQGMPPVVNDEQLAALTLHSCEEISLVQDSDVAVRSCEPYVSPGSDDVSHYAKSGVPIILIWTGSGSGDLHTPEFEIISMQTIIAPAQVLTNAMVKTSATLASSESGQPLAASGLQGWPASPTHTGKQVRPLADLMQTPEGIAQSERYRTALRRQRAMGERVCALLRGAQSSPRGAFHMIRRGPDGTFSRSVRATRSKVA